MSRFLPALTRLRDLFIVFSLVVLSVPSASADESDVLKLNGSGASFPAPLYLRWFRDYYLAHPDTALDYQSTGTTGGLKDLREGRVDFAGSDLMLGDEELAELSGGGVQVPLAAGGIVLVYNQDVVPDLKLTRSALIGIFSGTLARWNDPAIAASNEGVDLPDMPITVVARADSSGTSYKFSRFLSEISPEFAQGVGVSMRPNWAEALLKRGGLVRGRGNDGVAATVRAIPGSIGYVQYAFAHLTSMKMAMLENQSGQMVAPNEASFAAAIANISEQPGVQALRDPPGEESYPIIGVSWLSLRRHYDDPAKLPALIDLMEYALGPGQQDVAKLGYIPYPAEGIAYVQSLLDGLKQ
jgi:phosphate transport system substrate-binding protein